MRRQRRNRVDIWQILIILALGIFAFITLYPFIYVLAGSFNDGLDFDMGGVWFFPRKFSLDNYRAVFSDSRLWVALRNTVIRTVVGTAASLIFTSCVAYAMSQPDLPHKKAFRAMNVFTMFFSGGIIPFFVIVNVLGMYNTFWVYLLPPLYSVYNMIVMTSFFRGIPSSIREAALIDGAGDFRIWWSIYLPMSKPVLITVGLWAAVAHWNSYLPTLLYTDKSESMWTLQYYLMRIIKDAAMPESGEISPNVTAQTVSFAAMVLAMLPVVIAFPFLQRHLLRGSNIGAIKE